MFDECNKIYNGLKKYRHNELFKKEIPNVEEMIQNFEEDEKLFKEKFIEDDSLKEFCLSSFIELFEERKEDIKWFYENKKEIEYKDIKCKKADCSMEQKITIYNRCKSYMKACYYLYVEDWLYVLTQEECHSNLPVKFGMMVLENDIIWENYYF